MKTIKKRVSKPWMLLTCFVLFAICAWVGVVCLHGYRRAHFPQGIALAKYPQYEKWRWVVNGKEYELSDCPSVPGYIFEVKGAGEVQIKEELGCGLYILYTIRESSAESEIRFFHCTIDRICADSPIKYVEVII